MTLRQCYDSYIRSLSNQSRQFTQRLEVEATSLKALLIAKGDKPSTDDLQRVRRFLLDVETWKADCLEELTGHAAKNDRNQIWDALLGAVSAVKDLDALRSVMGLVGFGSSTDEKTGQRRAKRATAVL